MLTCSIRYNLTPVFLIIKTSARSDTRKWAGSLVVCDSGKSERIILRMSILVKWFFKIIFNKFIGQ